MNFKKFFQVATGGKSPYDWQIRLATDANCQSRLIDIPTGLGKTAAVVLAWLWNRLRQIQISNSESQIPSSKGDAWPRRLVYCLPMRTLVEQTRDNVALWLKNLSAKSAELGITGPALEELTWLMEHSPIILMGGEEPDDARRDWDLYPEKPAILIGTQDMLLSCCIAATLNTLCHAALATLCTQIRPLTLSQ